MPIYAFNLVISMSILAWIVLIAYYKLCIWVYKTTINLLAFNSIHNYILNAALYAYGDCNILCSHFTICITWFVMPAKIFNFQ